MTQQIFVGGKWRQGRGAVIEDVNPADGRTIARFAGASEADVADAVEAGKTAMYDSGWATLPPHQRARTLYRIGEQIEFKADAISRLQTQDTGKTLAETKALAISAANTFRYVASVLETQTDALTPSRGPYLTLSVHEPMGVIGAITPWNSPIASDAQKLAPALAAGNAVVLKPAEWTPLVSLFLAELCQEAGLPSGLLSVLPGPGRIVGDSLVRHPDVKKVTFTGGTTTGRSIAAIAAEKLMPVSLELGGKSPNIVLDDADLDHAINGVLFGIFSSTGQSCIAGSRIFVHKRIAATFTEELVRRTKALRVGSPTDPATQVGPMVATAHRDQVAAHVERGVGDGGELLCGGAAPPDRRLRDGAYYLPTLLSGLPNTSTICQQEIFGPVGVIIPFEDEDDLIAQCNDSVYGLAAGIWTRDFARAWRLAARIQTGTVWINTYKQFSISTPFGGTKDSGLGREKGLEGIRAYSNQKGIYVGMNTSPLPWAE